MERQAVNRGRASALESQTVLTQLRVPRDLGRSQEPEKTLAKPICFSVEETEAQGGWWLSKKIKANSRAMRTQVLLAT